MFTLTTLINVIVTMAMYAGMILLPIYLQQIRGFTPVESGLLMLPGAILMGIMSPITGAIFDKVGARWLAVIGLAITVITTWEFSNLTETMSYSHIMVIYTARMFGMSMLMMPIQTAGLNQLPRSLNAHGTAMSNTLRMVSGSIGTAILVTVMSTQAESKGEALMQSGLFDPKNQADLLKLGNEATIYGINYAFVIATWISVASFILALSRRPSRPKSRKPQKIRRLQQRTYNPIRFCAAQKGVSYPLIKRRAPFFISSVYIQCMGFSMRQRHILRLRPVKREITNRTMKMKNSTFAMLAAASTMPKKPKIPAISATTRKITDHFNILFTLLSSSILLDIGM